MSRVGVRDSGIRGPELLFRLMLMAAPVAQSEGLFGQIVVARHLATAADVQLCVQLQSQETAQGRRRTLGEIMIERGYVTAAQVKLVLEEQKRRRGPKRLGPYELLNKIGEGGMSAVYMARVAVTGIEVALKVLPRKYSDDSMFLGRFQREAKLGMDLEHPNIVRTVDFGEASGYHYIALEYVDGGSLDKLLKARNILTEQEALGIVREVAKALQYAFEKDLVHRDVKPSNIMLSSKGHVKLSDFGLVKHTDPEASKLTQSGLMVGTPHYISPEQARGSTDIDIRADIYSLGATLYHLVTGQTPFSGSSALVIITKHLKEELTPPDDINPGLSEGCVAVIEKMMAKERDDRYATPQQVIEDVEQVLRGEDPQNAALEAGKSSVRVSAKRYEKLQGRYVQQQGVRRTTGASALVSAGPGPGKHVVPGADLPSARGRTRSGVVDALGPADLAAGRHSPARGNEARVRRQTTGSQQPVGAVRLKPDDKQRAPSGEPRKLSRLSIVVCAAGVLFFLMGLLLALWPRSAPRDAPNKPGTTKGGITAPAGR